MSAVVRREAFNEAMSLVVILSVPANSNRCSSRRHRATDISDNRTGNDAGLSDDEWASHRKGSLTDLLLGSVVEKFHPGDGNSVIVAAKRILVDPLARSPLWYLPSGRDVQDDACLFGQFATIFYHCFEASGCQRGQERRYALSVAVAGSSLSPR